jgi:penicillin-binding protein 1C
MRKRLFIILLLLAGGSFLSTFLPFPRGRLAPGPVISLRLLDRNGLLLREVLSDEGGRCRWVRLEDVSAHFLKATIAAEDKMFFFHRGISPLSVMRAIGQNLRRGEVVSGASTITQQLVRTLYPGRRTIWSKAREAWLALRLERTLSKPEILVQYINRISYGNQVHGIEAASRLYFDKPSSQLSLAEAALLAAIPRSPARLNPYRSLSALKRRQVDVLAKMSELGLITKAVGERARAEELRLLPAAERFRAPHFCDFVLSQVLPEERKDLSIIETALDYALQQKVEILVRNNLAARADQGVGNGAVVVLDNATGEVLSLVGSRDFFDEAHAGQVNGALALRQPGSTLKPFTYSLALENGLTAASLIADSPEEYSRIEGNYRPQNYDRRFHGLISLRAALACSYNVPAVALLQAIGPELLYRRLHSLGFAGLGQDPGYYGVGLTLGNGEVSLLELVRAYAALARQGSYLQERSIVRLIRKDGRSARRPAQEMGPRSVIAPQVAYIITDILADQDARTPSFGYHNPLSLPFAMAAKTGTSKDFRDNWTVGYTPRFTVGVWVGNFAGEPMHNVSGISGSGPLFKDIMVLLNKDEAGTGFPKPKGVVMSLVCPQSGLRPTEACPGAIREIFVEGTAPLRTCDFHTNGPAAIQAASGTDVLPSPARIEVAFPRSGDSFKIDPVLRREHQRIKLKASVPAGEGIGKVEWWVNGEKVGEAGFPFSIFWNLRPGSFTIKATAVRGGQVLQSPPVKFVVVT